MHDSDDRLLEQPILWNLYKGLHKPIGHNVHFKNDFLYNAFNNIGTNLLLFSIHVSPDGEIALWFPFFDDNSPIILSVLTDKQIHIVQKNDFLKKWKFIFKEEIEKVTGLSISSLKELKKEWNQIVAFVTYAKLVREIGGKPIALSSNGEAILLSLGKTLTLQSVKNRRTIHTFDRDLSEEPLAAAISPNGKMACLVNKNNTVTLWNLSIGRTIETWENSESISFVKFSPNSKMVLFAGGKIVKLWSVENQRMIKTWENSEKVDSIIMFSPNSKMVFFSNYKVAKLWSIENQRMIKTWENSEIENLTLSPDGKFLLSQQKSDHTIRLWNTKNAKEIAKLLIFKDNEWVIMTPQGYYVASKGGEKYVKVRIGNKVTDINPYRTQFNRPKLVQAALQLKNIHLPFEDTTPLKEHNPPRILHCQSQTALETEIPINGTTYTLRAQAIDESSIESITVNNKTMTLDQQGCFSVAVQWQDTLKIPLQITATDIFNNQANKTITLVRDINCPTGSKRLTQFTPTKDLSRQEIDTMNRLKVKVAFAGEHQATIVPRDIRPQCLQQAEFLELSHLHLVGLPDWLAKFTQLRRLNLANNQLIPNNLAPLQKLSVLEILDLSHNAFFKESCWLFGRLCKIKPTMPPIWQHLTSLRELNLSHTGGDAYNYGDLSPLKNLLTLNLSHNRLETLTGLNLFKINALRRLNFSHNLLKNINFSEIGSIYSSLQELNFTHNQLGHLTYGPLPQLNRLYLRHNPQVSFAIEFGDPFKLPKLCMTVNEGTKMPKGLIEKLARCQ